MLTAGHSNHSLTELLGIIEDVGVRHLVDIRAHPGSQRFPWFNRASLAHAASEIGIDYTWEGRDLGGKRPPHPEDIDRHPALEDTSFCTFARYMEGERFRQAMDRLLAFPPDSTAILCAEADPARCHRSLMADHLETVRQCPVFHIMENGCCQRHTLHPGARSVGGFLRYDGAARQSQLQLK